MNITTIGLDIAKRVFHVVCCNQQGQLIKKKMLRRAQVHSFFQIHQTCHVASVRYVKIFLCYWMMTMTIYLVFLR